MRRSTLSLGMGSALIACLVIGAAASARAATLDFTGTLRLRMGTSFPAFLVSGTGVAQVTDDGSAHLLSFLLPGGSFGPVTTIVSLTTGSIPSIRLTLAGNLSGSFGPISGGPPGGGSMGLQGITKICLIATQDCSVFNVTLPLTPNAGAGIGMGGTQTVSGALQLTMLHAPWTIGQPTMTIHTAGSAITTPAIPGGFVHGPASLTSSTAQPSGALQLVTATKVFTSMTGSLPEFALTGILNLHFVPEPGTALLLGTGVAVLAALGRRRGAP